MSFGRNKAWTSCLASTHVGSYGRQKPVSLSTDILLCVFTLIVFSGSCNLAVAAEPSADDVAFFESKIRPILLERCTSCHGSDTQESGLRMDTFAGMIGGGNSGPIIQPGKADESMLMAAVSHKDPNLQMPPDEKLPEAEIVLLKEWINRGAPHPEMNGTPSVQPRRTAINMEEGRRFWAFQPIVEPAVPEVKEGASWIQSSIDAFLLEQLQQQGLKPVAAADKRTLIRRATFDLIGLPPSPEEIDEFLADTSPDAFEKVIDRLLASPHYGERWGRHWLDVARYADSNGLDENVAHVDAWRYRDYVIAAFNKDKPFDRFIVEQIAGDLLREKELGADAANSNDFELLIATGYLTLGAKVLAEADKVKMEMDIIDEQIDSIGQSILGLTLACARCHDHKFDPLGTADYYALAGILKSTKTMTSYATIAKWNEHVLATADEQAAKKLREETIAAKQKDVAEFIKTANEELAKTTGEAVPKDAKAAEAKYPEETKTQLAALRAEIESLKAANPDFPTAMGVAEGKVANTHIHVRGSHLTLGREVPRGVPEVIAPEQPVEFTATNSGRLQFAEWLVSDKNPLTARVAANRLWRWHFGTGIVATTDNFGELGTRPVNPRLLDWLAKRLMTVGWSFKAMHKEIMLSSTYRMSTQFDSDNAAIDLDNHFHWRANVQRLEAESIRDSLLSVSGLLDPTMGGSMIKTKKWDLVFNHTSMDGTTYDTNRRSVYLPVIRNNLYDAFTLFDYSTPDVTTGSRETSTVAPQALYMMNSDLVIKTASALTDRLFRENADDSTRVNRLFQLALGRDPTSDEQQRFLKFVTRLEQALTTGEQDQKLQHAAWTAAIQSVLASNEFVYVN